MSRLFAFFFLLFFFSFVFLVFHNFYFSSYSHKRKKYAMRKKENENRQQDEMDGSRSSSLGRNKRAKSRKKKRKKPGEKSPGSRASEKRRRTGGRPAGRSPGTKPRQSVNPLLHSSLSQKAAMSLRSTRAKQRRCLELQESCASNDHRYRKLIGDRKSLNRLLSARQLYSYESRSEERRIMGLRLRMVETEICLIERDLLLADKVNLVFFSLFLVHPFIRSSRFLFRFLFAFFFHRATGR